MSLPTGFADISDRSWFGYGYPMSIWYR